MSLIITPEIREVPGIGIEIWNSGRNYERTNTENLKIQNWDSGYLKISKITEFRDFRNIPGFSGKLECFGFVSYLGIKAFGLLDINPVDWGFSNQGIFSWKSVFFRFRNFYPRSYESDFFRFGDLKPGIADFSDLDFFHCSIKVDYPGWFHK